MSDLPPPPPERDSHGPRTWDIPVPPEPPELPRRPGAADGEVLLGCGLLVGLVAGSVLAVAGLVAVISDDEEGGAGQLASAVVSPSPSPRPSGTGDGGVVPTARATPTAVRPSARPTGGTTVVVVPPVEDDGAPVAAGVAAAALLTQGRGGDGDSWKDSNGVEYRMGLVNAPEVDECGGSAATDYRRGVLADGFRAEAYTTDAYGRKVAVVYAANGVNLNVDMAREGLVDDRFLAQYRSENPPLARELDAAFASAKAARRGVWGDCAGGGSSSSDSTDAGGSGGQPPPPPPPADSGSGCHPAYETCIPVKGSGSGAGEANDLDCSDIQKLVLIKAGGGDPYRLDGDDDDLRGCEGYA